MFSQIYSPNRITAVCTNNSTQPLIVGMSGTGYASLAALRAAGDTPFPFGNKTTPGLDNGMFAMSVSVENVTNPADSFDVAWNTAVAPTNNTSTLVPGNIPQLTIPGPVWAVWVTKSVGTDNLVLTCLF